jgi:hypothetical protein
MLVTIQEIIFNMHKHSMCQGEIKAYSLDSHLYEKMTAMNACVELIMHTNIFPISGWSTTTFPFLKLKNSCPLMKYEYYLP